MARGKYRAAKKLAAQLDQFIYEFDPYLYADQIDDTRNSIEDLADDLMDDKRREGIIKYLRDISIESEGTDKKAEELQFKVKAFAKGYYIVL